MYCIECGTDLSGKENGCSQCGTKVDCDNPSPVGLPLDNSDPSAARLQVIHAELNEWRKRVQLPAQHSAALKLENWRQIVIDWAEQLRGALYIENDSDVALLWLLRRKDVWGSPSRVVLEPSHILRAVGNDLIVILVEGAVSLLRAQLWQEHQLILALYTRDVPESQLWCAWREIQDAETCRTEFQSEIVKSVRFSAEIDEILGAVPLKHYKDIDASGRYPHASELPLWETPKGPRWGLESQRWIESSVLFGLPWHFQTHLPSVVMEVRGAHFAEEAIDALLVGNDIDAIPGRDFGRHLGPHIERQLRAWFLGHGSLTYPTSHLINCWADWVDSACDVANGFYPGVLHHLRNGFSSEDCDRLLKRRKRHAGTFDASPGYEFNDPYEGCQEPHSSEIDYSYEESSDYERGYDYGFGTNGDAQPSHADYDDDYADPEYEDGGVIEQDDPPERGHPLQLIGYCESEFLWSSHPRLVGMPTDAFSHVLKFLSGFEAARIEAAHYAAWRGVIEDNSLVRAAYILEIARA